MRAVFIDLVALVVLVLLFYCLYFGGWWLVGLGMLCGLVVACWLLLFVLRVVVFGVLGGCLCLVNLFVVSGLVWYFVWIDCGVDSLYLLVGGVPW